MCCRTRSERALLCMRDEWLPSCIPEPLVEKIILTKTGRFGQFAPPNQRRCLEIRNKALSSFSPHQHGILRGMLSSEKKAGFILTAIAASEGTWVVSKFPGGCDSRARLPLFAAG